MEFIPLPELSKEDKETILKLWNEEYPASLSYTYSEFETYLEALTDQFHVVVKSENQTIEAWYFDFIREGERWFAIIVGSRLQGKGLGSKLLDLAKEKRAELNGWVMDKEAVQKNNGELYKSPLRFYLKNGFDHHENERLENKKMSAVKIKWMRTPN